MIQSNHILRAFLKSGGTIGAIAPSSTQLTRLMVDWLDWDSMNCVIEYGAGTGVFTEAIANRLPSGSRFLAIERDPWLASLVQLRCPTVDVRQDCVTNVDALCRSEGIEKVDAIVSGLPWASFSSEWQDECLANTFRVLRTGGQFATFAYWQGLLLPSGQRFRRRLRENFRAVAVSPTVWQNLPPAFVYRCVR